jgi:hypothetical protein
MTERVEIECRQKASQYGRRQTIYGSVLQFALVISGVALFSFFSCPSSGRALFLGASMAFLVVAATLLVSCASQVVHYRSVLQAHRPRVSSLWTQEDCLDVEVIGDDRSCRQTSAPASGKAPHQLRYLYQWRF